MAYPLPKIRNLMNKQLRVGIFGANGRMGRSLISMIAEADQLQLAGAYVRPGNNFIGMDAGEMAGVGALNCGVTDQLDPEAVDIVIDFTLPEGMVKHLAWCRQYKIPMVVGTTGVNVETLAALEQAGEDIPLLFSANMSKGVNLLFKLVHIAAKAIGQQSDIEVIEAHHRFKKDAPSGTAVKIGEVIAKALDRDLNKHAIYGREGITEERDRETIGFATVRAGDITGDHTVMFGDIGERLELTHRAHSRDTFARGALDAALWLVQQPKGFYKMEDIFEL